MDRGRTSTGRRGNGVTLTTWLAESVRSWTAVLGVMRRVGEALAERHDGGGIHGRLSPDAIELGDGGQVRLLDAGAPAASFCAPEGGPSTRASDQFAFCAVLFAALVGHPPDEGREDDEDWWPRWPHGLPAWLGHVVLRGLSARPEDRWPSMRAVVAALVPPREGTRRGALVAGAVALAGVAAWGLVPMQGDRCTVPPTAWDSEHATAARRALAVGLDDDAIDRIAGAMDRWQRDVSEQRLAVCRGEDQAPELVPHALACLDRAAARHAALADALATADATVAARADAAVAALPPPHACTDATRLRDEPPLDERPEVAELAADLERARALLSVGRDATAEQLLHQTLARAVDLDDASTLGRAQWLAGALAARDPDPTAGIALMERAVQTLTDAAAPREAAKVAVSLAAAYERSGDPERALMWATTAATGYHDHGATTYERATLDATTTRIRKALTAH